MPIAVRMPIGCPLHLPIVARTPTVGNSRSKVGATSISSSVALECGTTTTRKYRPHTFTNVFSLARFHIRSNACGADCMAVAGAHMYSKLAKCSRRPIGTCRAMCPLVLLHFFFLCSLMVTRVLIFLRHYGVEKGDIHARFSFLFISRKKARQESLTTALISHILHSCGSAQIEHTSNTRSAQEQPHY